MKFKITTYTHFKRLFFLVIYFIFFISILYYTFNIEFMAVICILALGIFTFPTLYIHINYYKYLSGEILFLEETQIRIESLKTNTVSTFNISDINKVNLFMSGTRIANLVKKNFVFENYYYYEIEFINKDKIIISSLYNENIDSIFKQKYPNIKLEVINVYYPLIQYS